MKDDSSSYLPSKNLFGMAKVWLSEGFGTISN